MRAGKHLLKLQEVVDLQKTVDSLKNDSSSHSFVTAAERLLAAHSSFKMNVWGTKEEASAAGEEYDSAKAAYDIEHEAFYQKKENEK